MKVNFIERSIRCFQTFQAKIPQSESLLQMIFGLHPQQKQKTPNISANIAMQLKKETALLAFLPNFLQRSLTSMETEQTFQLCITGNSIPKNNARLHNKAGKKKKNKFFFPYSPRTPTHSSSQNTPHHAKCLFNKKTVVPKTHCSNTKDGASEKRSQTPQQHKIHQQQQQQLARHIHINN
jgi:hypothetical protein